MRASRTVCGLIALSGILFLGARAADEDKRAPIPDAAKLKEAETLLKDIFKDDYAKTKPADKSAFARKMIQQAQRTTDDPGGKYVLYREAPDLAVQALDIETAMQAIDEMAASFVTARLPDRISTLQTIFAASKTKEQAPALTDAAMSLIDELLA